MAHQPPFRPALCSIYLLLEPAPTGLAGVVALCYEMMLWSQLCQVNLAAHLLLLLSSLFKWKVKCAGHIIVYSAEAELASCFVDSETYTVL